jgi:hypothetical protein
MNQYSDTTEVVLWFSTLWHQLKHSPNRQEEIQERIQNGIVNCNCIDKENLDELGELVWVDFTDFKKINSLSTSPKIQEAKVCWNEVGKSIAEKVLINFWESEKDDEEEDCN